MITLLMAILTVAMALSGCSFGPAPTQATHTAPPPPAAVAPAADAIRHCAVIA